MTCTVQTKVSGNAADAGGPFPERYRCSYEPRRSTWNTPRNLNVSNLASSENLQVQSRITSRQSEQSREGLAATSITRFHCNWNDVARVRAPHPAPRSTWNTYRLHSCSTWNMDRAESNPVRAAAAFAQDSSLCTQLCVAFEVEWHYSAPISGFSKN
jgi:hypothetical protein